MRLEKAHCPACLADDQGRWQLHWRLGWAFACTRHNLLLLERCPACGKHPPVASGGNHRMLPRPEACRALTDRTGRGARCGFPLTNAPAVGLSSGGAVLLAQAHVNATVIADHHNPSALERAGELSYQPRPPPRRGVTPTAAASYPADTRTRRQSPAASYVPPPLSGRPGSALAWRTPSAPSQRSAAREGEPPAWPLW
ncbi:TniQ family protein [Streptomyces sp. NBC_01116]|uniref:hypothetical protein n=1 Tax=Streptomyces sp. NBC_01116 TaxID=2903752 RepID=UPI003251A7BB